jgi:hypothetical protein
LSTIFCDTNNGANNINGSFDVLIDLLGMIWGGNWNGKSQQNVISFPFNFFYKIIKLLLLMILNCAKILFFITNKI